MRLVEYITAEGQSPFAKWFDVLPHQPAAKIAVALTRLELGNFSNVKSVGEGVLEYRLDFGPGYRIYFGRDNDTVIILLIGGTKQRQQNDIQSAKHYWNDYKKRKRS